jgi:diacylglycerol kinase
MALLWVSGDWCFKDHNIVPLLLRVLQSEWRTKSLRPLKMTDNTHTTIRRHIIEDQNLQQHRCHNITCLTCRCLCSHSYNQMTCMWCYLLFTLSSVYISSLISVSCATEPSTSTYHSTFGYSNASQAVTVTHDVLYLHISLRIFDFLRSIPYGQSMQLPVISTLYRLKLTNWFQR